MRNQIVREYIDKLLNYLQLDNYIGVIAYGSYVSGRSNKFSDLDVMIIKKEHETADCGSLVIGDIRIEFFVQSLKNLYQLIKKEVDNNDPSHLTKFATCEIFYDTNKDIDKFIKYAKKMYDININTSFNQYDKFSLFSINNRLEDLEELTEFNSFYAAYFVTLEKIREAYHNIYGIIQLPLTKIEQLYKNNDFAKKYIASDYHHLPSKKFIDLYLDCLNIDNPNKMLCKIHRLFDYSFKNLKFDSKNFYLSFNKENAPFKV